MKSYRQTDRKSIFCLHDIFLQVDGQNLHNAATNYLFASPFLAAD